MARARITGLKWLAWAAGVAVLLVTALVAYRALLDRPAVRQSNAAGLRLMSPPPRKPGLVCEREEYPCSWAKVTLAVFDRSLELGEAALVRSRDASPADALAWLTSLDDVAVATLTADSNGIIFRVQGGARVWVTADDSSGFLGGGPALTDVVATLAPVRLPGRATRVEYVVGGDTDGNTRINQRDRRRALVVDPYRSQFVASWPDYAAGQIAAQIFESSPVYRGNVDVLVDQAAGLEAFRSWDRYDAIHVTTHGGVSDCDASGWCAGVLATGERLDVAGLDIDERLELLASLADDGLVLAVKGTVEEEITAPVWQLAIDYDFMASAYPSGIGRAIVMLAACSSYSEVIHPLLTASSGDDQPLIYVWDRQIFLTDVQQAAESIWARLVVGGFNTGDAAVAVALDQPGLAAHGGGHLRAREILRIVDAGGNDLGDGTDMTPLVSGVLGDGQPDHLNVVVKVDGVSVPDEGLVVDAGALRINEALHMEAWLELDGRRIGSPVGLFDKPRVGSVVTVPFANVPLGLDIQEGRTYELEAVVMLPRERDEEGESRYSVRLRPGSCAVPPQGDYQGTLGGDRARTVAARSRGAFAKILPSPLGGWALQMESRERDGRDLSLLLQFDELPEEGTTVSIQDPGWVEPGVGGQVDRFERDRQVSWVMGTVAITFDRITARPDKPFDWVCGQVAGNLIGFMEPPPGSAQPVQVNGAFDGHFNAEWHRRR